MTVRNERADDLIQRMFGAALRAFLVGVVFSIPAFLLPQASPDAVQMAAVFSLIAAGLTFAEYTSNYPSLIEFREAPPYNRMRFVALFVTVLMLTLIARDATYPTAFNAFLAGLGRVVGGAMDFPFSPVRLMVLLVPEGAEQAQFETVRVFAGLAYLVSLLSLLVFTAIVRLLDWPIRHGAFNFWVNLPLFDPTAGGDVLYRLKRDSHVNVALGFLLPFAIPAILQLASSLAVPLSMNDPQSLIWMMSAWAFLPASLIMRGVALMRIADLIEEKRRRAYAQAELQVA